jgi:hypothetical protein
LAEATSTGVAGAALEREHALHDRPLAQAGGGGGLRRLRRCGLDAPVHGRTLSEGILGVDADWTLDTTIEET